MTLRTLLLFCAIACLQVNCKDDDSLPPDNKPPLGKRNYVWTIDTIAYPGNMQTLMSDIWGSSSKSVFVVGHSDGSSAATMFRYDGLKWSTTKYHTREGGPIKGSITLDGVHSFSNNDVWAVGSSYHEYPVNSNQYVDSSIIVHFNGIGWHEHKVSGGRGLLTVWGTDSNNVWVGGHNGSLYRIDRSAFQKIPYSTYFSIANIHGLRSDSVYIRSYLHGHATDLYTVLDVYTQGQLMRIDSTRPYPATPQFGSAYVNLVRPNILYTSGEGGVFERTSAGWMKVLDTGTEIITSVRGNSSNNLFAVGRGKVYHYNGEDWYRYEQFSDQNVLWVRVWTDGNEVFIIGQTLDGWGKTIVLHGK